MFKVLKKRLTIELILVVPDLDKRMRSEVNILDYTISIRVSNFELSLFYFISLSFLFFNSISLFGLR